MYVNCGECGRRYYCQIDPSECDNMSGVVFTNADKIRSMSDDELAAAIAEHACTGACNDFGITVNVKCCRNCTKCTGIIDWLKQPAEVSE